MYCRSITYRVCATFLVITSIAKTPPINVETIMLLGRPSVNTRPISCDANKSFSRLRVKVTRKSNALSRRMDSYRPSIVHPIDWFIFILNNITLLVYVCISIDAYGVQCVITRRSTRVECQQTGIFISLIIHTRLVTVPFNSRHSFTMFKRRLMLLSEFSSFFRQCLW